MPRGKTTDTKTKLKAISSYVNTNSYNATSKEIGISDKTVKKIVEENPNLYEQKKQEFINKSSRIIDMAMDKLEIEIEKGIVPANHLTTIIGTMYDKRALAKGEATENATFSVDINVIE